MNAPPLVQLTAVDVVLDGVTALRDVSLAVAGGERVGLVGPSGAGKSTLLGLLNATVAATRGSVEFCGQTVVDSDSWRREHGRRIATIPQQLHLSGPLRAVHNVNAGRLGQWSTARALWSLVSPLEVREARRVMETVGIADKLFVRTDRLSGGEQQRVAIARALRQEPRLLLADEPTANLDPARAADVMRLLRSSSAGADCALIVSQHDLSLAVEHCDRIVGLRSGVVQFDRLAREVTEQDVRLLYALDAAR